MLDPDSKRRASNSGNVTQMSLFCDVKYTWPYRTIKLERAGRFVEHSLGYHLLLA